MNKIILGLLAMSITILMIGCGDSGSDTSSAPSVTSIEVNASAETVALGLSVSLSTISNLSDLSSQDVTTQATYVVQDNTILE